MGPVLRSPQPMCTGSCFYSKTALDVPVCNPVKCCLFLIGFCWQRRNIGLLGLMLQPEEEEERRTEVGTDPIPAGRPTWCRQPGWSWLRGMPFPILLAQCVLRVAVAQLLLLFSYGNVIIILTLGLWGFAH